MPYISSSLHKFKITCRLHPIESNRTQIPTQNFREYSTHYEHNTMTTLIDVHQEFTYSINLYQIVVALGQSLDSIIVQYWVNDICGDQSECTLSVIEAANYLLISPQISLKDTIGRKGRLRLQLRPVYHLFSKASMLPSCFDFCFDYSIKQNVALNPFRMDYSNWNDAAAAPTEYNNHYIDQRSKSTEQADDMLPGCGSTGTSDLQCKQSERRARNRSDRRRSVTPASSEQSRRPQQMQEDDDKIEMAAMTNMNENDTADGSVPEVLSNKKMDTTELDATWTSNEKEGELIGQSRDSLAPQLNIGDDEGSFDQSADALSESLSVENMSEFAKRAQEARKARALVEAEIEAYEKQEAEEEEAKLLKAEKRLSYLKRKRVLQG